MAALLQAAIKSLDHLNEQIVQLVYTSSLSSYRRAAGGGIVGAAGSQDHRDLSAKDHETLRTSMSLMRHLLVDAQAKFRKMVDDNKKLASRIDGSIQAANQEVQAIRDELVDTNRRLTQLGRLPDGGGGGGEVRGGGDDGLRVNEEVKSQGKDRQEKEAAFSSLKEENTRLTKIIEDLNSELCRLRESKSDSGHEEGDEEEEEEEDSRTEDVICAVKTEHVTASPMGVPPSETSPTVVSSSAHMEQCRDLQQQVVQANQELSRAMEALQAMKTDRKRLQSEKLDLLSQLRQLYCTLEDKDSEIRDFIRNFEQQMRESNESIKTLAVEKEECEQEKWEVLKKAQEASEHCIVMKAELEAKNEVITSLENQLTEATEQIKNYENQLKNCNTSVDSSSDQIQSSTGSTARIKSSSASVDSVLKSSSLDQVDANSPSSEELPPYQEVVVSDHNRSRRSQSSNSSHFSFGAENFTQSLEQFPPAAESSRSSDDMNIEHKLGIVLPPASAEIKTFIDLKQLQAAKKRRSTSAISRLFGKSRTRRSIAVSDPSILEDHLEEVSPRLSMLSEDNYQSKLDALKQAKELGVTKWKAGHVLSWLEIEMNMPMYGKACGENIKSGKVLLGLSDSELDSALCLDSPLHRRKLRLAIEELRDPTTIRFARASQLDHTWVAHRWLSDLGLPQYSAGFEAQLVDGRLLNVLTKKDLERHLGVQRRFHQNSILYGVELLRKLKFSKEELMQRRALCEASDTDPLVWTNHRLLQWLQGIDLHEYVKSLHESGIHGAVLVLEHAFNAEAFASALNIPQTKSYVRRHLASELDNLIRPARAALEGLGKRSRSSSASLNRSFMRSYRGGTGNEEGQRNSLKRHSFRGSLTRALGRKSRQDDVVKLDQDSETPVGSTDKVAAKGVSRSGNDRSSKCQSMEVQSTSV